MGLVLSLGRSLIELTQYFMIIKLIKGGDRKEFVYLIQQ